MGRILEWTRRHGLLGVLHKHLFALTDDIDSSFYHQFILVGPRLVECNRRYDRGVRIRSYEGWAVNYLPQDLGSTPRGTYAIESDHSENICYITDRFLLPLPDDLYKDAMQRLPPSASAVVDPAPHDDQPLDDQPLDDQQPDLVDTMSDEFFAGYCEPIEHWFGDVFAFAEGVYEKGQGEFPIDLSRISLQFTRANGTPELRHTYASLLDALALMFAQDQITGYRVVQCAGCGCDVVTTAYQALYCSRRCGDRDRKRKSRAAAAAKLAKMA